MEPSWRDGCYKMLPPKNYPMNHHKPVNQLALRGLAGASLLASGTQAYALVMSASSLPADLIPGTVPTTPANAFLTSNWDVDGDGLQDFVFGFRQPQSPTTFDWQGIVQGVPAGNGGSMFFSGPYLRYSVRLNSGDTVDATGSFSLPNQGVVLGSRYAGSNYGQFQAPNSRGFIGFRFSNASGLHFGWLELQAKRSSGGDIGIQFFNAAYESDAGAAIRIPSAAVPDSGGTLGILAIGAGALALQHRRSRRLALARGES
jgi:hypothetical protein